MPSQIDYSKRGWAENIFDPGAWRNLLGDVASVVREVGTVWEEIEKVEGSQSLSEQLSEFQPYRPELTWRDFKFTPNFKLIAVGCGLLLLAYVLSRKK